MRVPDIANRKVVASEVNLDICTIDPRRSQNGSRRRARIAATLKGGFVIRRDSPWIVDANGNALKLLALGAWHGLIRPSGRVRSDQHQVRKPLKEFNHKYNCIPSKFCVASSSKEGKTSKSVLIKPDEFCGPLGGAMLRSCCFF